MVKVTLHLLTIVIAGLIQPVHTTAVSINGYESGTSVSQQVKVTAVVPLSDLWASEISNNSKVRLEESNPFGKDIRFSIQIIGLNNELMKQHTVKAIIMYREQVVEEIVQRTDEQGEVSYSYVPENGGEYRIYFVDETFQRKVTLKEDLKIIPPILTSTLPLT